MATKTTKKSAAPETVNGMKISRSPGAAKTLARGGDVLTASIEDEMMIVHIPIRPFESGSGKSYVLASTRGNVTLDLEWEGQPIILGFNAYIRKV